MPKHSRHRVKRFPLAALSALLAIGCAPHQELTILDTPANNAPARKADHYPIARAQDVFFEVEWPKDSLFETQVIPVETKTVFFFVLQDGVTKESVYVFKDPSIPAPSKSVKLYPGTFTVQARAYGTLSPTNASPILALGESTFTVEAGKDTNVSVTLIKNDGSFQVPSTNVSYPYGHSYRMVSESGADDYVIQQNNVKKYTENWSRAGDPVTYWGPATSGTGYLTYGYNAGTKTIRSAKLKASLVNFNQSLNGGSGHGYCWIEGSKDKGQTWVTILENPKSITQASVTKTFDGELPASLFGSSTLHVRVGFYSTMAGGSHTFAQFSRATADQKDPIFKIEFATE